MGQREKEQARRRKGRVSPIGSYTGFPDVNTKQFTQPRQSGNNSLDARGFVKTDIREVDEQARQREPSFVDQLESTVNTYKGVKKAYKDGQSAAKWFREKDLFGGGSEPAGLLNSPDPSTVVNPGATAAPFNPDVGGPSAGDANMGLWADNPPQGAYDHGAVAGVQGQSMVNPDQNPLFADTPVLNDSVGSGAGTGYGGLTSTPPPNDPGMIAAATQNNALGKASNLQVGDQAFSNFLSGGKTALSGLLGQGGGDALAGTYSAASGGAELAGNAATEAGTQAIANTGMQAGVEAGAEAGATIAAESSAELAKEGAGNMLGNAAPFVSGAIQAYQAHESFKRGDYVNGSIDTIQVGIGFIPIPGISLLNIPIDLMQSIFS